MYNFYKEKEKMKIFNVHIISSLKHANVLDSK